MNITDFINAARGPRHWHLAELIVVNPYPVADFFSRISEALKPKRCILFVDDGWSEVRVNAVIKALQSCNVCAKVQRVRAIDPGGLVHAKLYLFHWQNQKRTINFRKLYLGSPNASPHGFGRHAEALVEIYLKYLRPEIREEISTYFRSISSGHDNNQGISIKITDGVRVWLPPIEHASRDSPSFDAWVRSGRLCHRYIPDPTFGKLTVKLRKPLPKTDHEDIFAEQGFIREARREILQRAYAGTIDSIDDSPPQWRSKYFTETDYSDWTSNDCFVKEQRGELTANGRLVAFQAQDAQERSEILDTIRNAQDEDHIKWISEFEKKLTEVANKMRQAGLRPEKYLFINGSGLARYRKGWRKKLQSDRARAKIQEFYDRMKVGFAFPLVPPLGSDYERFVHGLCATLLRGSRLLRKRNALAKTISNLIGKNQLAEINNGDEMYKKLLELWDESKNRKKIQNFYLDES